MYRPVSRTDLKALVAAVPYSYTDTWADLPSTVEEAQTVMSVLPTSAIIALPNRKDPVDSDGGQRFSTQILLENLPDASILHLACHGMQDHHNPLKSGFVMSDQVLTIEKLIPISLPRAFLAFLSACETAKGDKVRLDSDLAFHD
jgi:CHAT domain-containing protein